EISRYPQTAVFGRFFQPPRDPSTKRCFLNLFSCRPLGTAGEILAFTAALRITSATALLNPPRILDGEGRRMIYCPAVATQKFLAPHKRARSGARGNQRRMREF
ncbi:MAG: hypothetical protein VYB20_01180, partial [Pseudomonadota bacterium]|nr:hypothetical protein [Pseudomonadota bacterium]